MGVRELMLGIIAVGLTVGILVGRDTERARRLFKDWGAAKAAVPKAKTTFMTQLRRAVLTVTAVVFALAVLVLALYRPND